MADLRIGIDVGGTHTDAVLVDRSRAVLAWVKVPTTADPAVGIERALGAVTPDDPGSVTRVALGTTRALNAVLQRDALAPVAVIRVAGPATRSVLPLSGWPPDLRAAVEAGSAVVRGGVEVDGRRHPIDPDEVRRFLDSVASGARAVAITGMFSPLDPQQELEVESLVRETLGSDLPVSLGHEIGGLGLLERENAAVLNAALVDVAVEVADAFTAALERCRLPAATFLTQNDGTLMAVEHARRFPVLTIGSGPANSMRGAAAITGLADAIVVDVGGTSTDVGALVRGFPRESAVGIDVGGVRTNFRMPDLVSVALGGGTIIDATGALTSRSVGARLVEEALVFGGETPTLSDAAVAAGRTSIGDAAPARAAERILLPALREAEARVVDAIDRVKLVRSTPPLVLVGGGSVLLPNDLPGVTDVHRPEHFDVANAIGAALAPVGGEADHVAFLGAGGREEAIAACLEQARDRAVAAGADLARLETIWIEETPLAYLNVPATRVRAKVAGPPRQ